MRKVRIIVILLLFTTVLTVAQRADDIIGKYHLPNKLDVEIYKDGNTFSGKIIALNGYKNGIVKDVKNSNASKRNEPLIGKEILTNLKFDANDKKWVNGKMYGPEKGITVNFKVIEVKNNEITVVGSKFFFWKTLQWKRLK